MRKSSILMLTAVAALGSSFLVPADASASSRGFAHAARVSRSVHASTGSVHTASFGFHRSTGFQRPMSSGTVASGSFTRRRFGSANMANRTFGRTGTPTNTPQLNKLASNGAQLNTTHSLADPCSGLGAPSTCFLNQGKGVAGTNNQPTPAPAPTPKTTGGANVCSGVGAPSTCFLNQGKGVAGTNNQPTPAPAPAPKTTGGADKCSGVGAPSTCFLNQGKGVAGTNNQPTPTSKTTGGPGDPCSKPPYPKSCTATNVPTTQGNGNKTTSNQQPPTPPTPPTPPSPPVGGHHPHPFPGQFPVGIGMGQGPFVGGPVAVGVPVAVGGSIAPVAVAPVASVGGALPPVTVPSAPRPLAPSCLKKTYLQTGLVMFRDVCSQEWAINSSSITNPAPTHRACLSKENPQDGVVLFKDNCTSEWAMNPQPADNQAQAK